MNVHLVDGTYELFRQYLTSEKRASPHTLRAYLHDVAELEAFARKSAGQGTLALSALDVQLCRSYLASLHGRNDAVTIGRKLSSLRAFFRLAVTLPDGSLVSGSSASAVATTVFTVRAMAPRGRLSRANRLGTHDHA